MDGDNLSLLKTHDGSHTIYNAQLNETYHSIHGARQEGFHVFIENGLFQLKKKEVSILEIGLGTGLNALLTHQNSKRKIIEYISLEPFPLIRNLLDDFIAANAKNKKEEEFWLSIMNAEESICLKIADNFNLTWYRQTLQNFCCSKTFDIIYFDAFAPNKQSEMWEVSVFEKLFNLLKFNGMLVTYCAQGQFKRNLKAAGFKVETRPGPPGKREMTVGVK